MREQDEHLMMIFLVAIKRRFHDKKRPKVDENFGSNATIYKDVQISHRYRLNNSQEKGQRIIEM